MVKKSLDGSSCKRYIISTSATYIWHTQEKGLKNGVHSRKWNWPIIVSSNTYQFNLWRKSLSLHKNNTFQIVTQGYQHCTWIWSWPPISWGKTEIGAADGVDPKIKVKKLQPKYGSWTRVDPPHDLRWDIEWTGAGEGVDPKLRFKS